MNKTAALSALTALLVAAPAVHAEEAAPAMPATAAQPVAPEPVAAPPVATQPVAEPAAPAPTVDVPPPAPPPAVEAAKAAPVALEPAAAPESSVTSDPDERSPETQEKLTGNWGGARDTLGDWGLSIDALYTLELFGRLNRVSDRQPLMEPLGHGDLALTFDTSKRLFPGGKLYALFQGSHGRGLSPELGVGQTLSNLETDEFVGVSELFYEQSLLGERLTLRLGKQDSNRDFGAPRYGGNFINDGFGAFPTVPDPTYPTTGWGFTALGAPLPWLQVKAAVYEGDPVGVFGFGLPSALEGGHGWHAIGAVQAKHELSEGSGVSGTTQLGAWHQRLPTSEVPNPAITPPDSANGGFFFHDERIRWNPADPNDPRGLALSVRAAMAQRSVIDPWLYTGSSVAWHGLGPRMDDTVGIGHGTLTYGDLSGPNAGRTELVVEAFYKWRATPWLSLQPDFQYVRSPGGNVGDALVGALRVKLKL